MADEQEKPDFLEGTTQREKAPETGITLTSGAEFWPFQQKPTFRGIFIGEHYSEETDDEGNQKLLGYDMQDKDGRDWIIGNSYAIEKSLNTQLTIGDQPVIVRDIPKVEFWIEFLGQTKNAKGQDFNRFKVMLVGPTDVISKATK